MRDLPTQRPANPHPNPSPVGEGACARSLALPSPECLDERTWGHRKISELSLRKSEIMLLSFLLRNLRALSGASEDDGIDIALATLGTGIGADFSWLERL